MRPERLRSLLAGARGKLFFRQPRYAKDGLQLAEKDLAMRQVRWFGGLFLLTAALWSALGTIGQGTSQAAGPVTLANVEAPPPIKAVR